MFRLIRLYLLFSCLILLKIAIAVTKGIYLIVLKVCNEIESTLKCEENSHFSQNGHQSEMDSYHTNLLSTRSRNSNVVNPNHHSPSVDFLIYNLPIGRKTTVRHLKNYEVVTDSSEITCDKPNNFRQGMTVQETKHPVWFEPRKAFDGAIPRTSLDCSTPLKRDYITPQDRNNQNQAKGIGSFPKSLYRDMSVENSLNKSDESFNLYEKEMIQSGETQYFKDTKHNSDTYIVKSNAFQSNYTVTEHPRDESEIDCQSDDNYKDSGDIVETNKEVYLSYPKDDGKVASCSQLYNSDETNGKYNFQKNLMTFEIQGKAYFETSKMNIEGSKENRNHSKSACVDKCNTVCSGGPIKDKMLNDEACNGCETETVTATEKAPENTKHGVNLTAKDFLSTFLGGRTEAIRDTEKALESTEHGENLTAQTSLSTGMNINTKKSASSSPIPEETKSDDAAFLDVLIYMKPTICLLEDALEALSKLTTDKRKSSGFKLTTCCLNILADKLKLIKDQTCFLRVHEYINEIRSTFTQVLNYEGSYPDDIRRILVKKREILLSNSEELNNIFTERKGIPKAVISSKGKSKKKRRR